MAATKPWRVIITRPSAQAQPWAAQLHTQGFACVQLPLLELVALHGEEEARRIQNKVMDFDLYQKAIFVSRNAVHYGLEWLERYWPQLPMGIEYFAVGATTARELAAYGLRVTDLAQAESGSMTSETLLQAPGLQQVDGERIIIFRGQGGRGYMGDELRARGAWVDYCELYRRQLPPLAATQWQQLLADQHSWQAHTQVIALHSGESLKHLAQLLAQAEFVTWRERLLQTRLLLPSQRLVEEAQAMGFNLCLLASNATDPAMAAALCEARAA